jgi:hypothetical protein
MSSDDTRAMHVTAAMDFELLPDRATPPTPPRQSPSLSQPPPPFAAEEQEQGEEMP